MPDIDEENQACMAQDAPAPAVAPAPASAEPAEPSENDSSIRLSTPDEAREKAESLSQISEGMETEGTLAKILNGAPKEIEGEPMGMGDRLGGALSLPGDALGAAKAMHQIADGDLADGVPDAIIDIAKTTGDAAKIMGNEGVAGPAGAIANAGTFGKGVGEIGRAIFGDDPAPGQWSHDRGDDVMSGINDILHGGAGLASDAENPWVKGAGEALGAGMALGDDIAPLVFGDKDEPGSHQEEVPEDGKFNATSGNGAVDWVFGVGKYTNGRFGNSDGGGAPAPDAAVPVVKPDDGSEGAGGS
jgi:hypothetical protein